MHLRSTAYLAMALSALLLCALITEAGEPKGGPARGSEPCFDAPFMFGNTLLASFVPGPGTGMVPFRLNASDIAVGDFTGDQVSDVATISLPVFGNFGFDWLSFFKANGDGTFAQPAQQMLLELPYSMTANDFNGDGHLDIAISHQYNKCCDSGPCCGSGAVPNLSPPGPMVLVLLNDGAGNFTALPAVGPAARLRDITSGDLTGDGRPEIVVCFFDCDPCPGCQPCPACAGCATPDTPKIYVLWNDGSGQFPAFTEFATSCVINPPLPPQCYKAKSVAVGDVDGDLDNDVIVGTSLNSSKLELFRNTGGGSFAPREEFPLGERLEKIDLADIDGDGDLDAVVDYANSSEQRQGLALNNGAGVFSLTTIISLGRPNGLAQFVGDVTGDGRPDIVTSVAGALGSSAGDEFVVLVNTGGTFAPPVLYHAGTQPAAIGAGDINGDGVTDIVVGDYGADHTGGCTVFAGAPGGQFYSDRIYPFIAGFNQGHVGTWALRSGDLDHDGDADLICCRLQAGNNDFVARVLLNDGTGAFTIGSTVPTGDYINRMALSDLNNDGSLDLITLLMNQPGTGQCHVQVHIGQGNGSFGPTVQEIDIVGTGSAGDIDAADLNGDGWIDIIASPQWEEPSAVFGGPPGPPMRVNVLMNDGAGGLLPPTAYAVSPPVSWQPNTLTPRGLREAAVGDLNGDQRPDIATVIDFGRKLTVLINNGDGTFGPMTIYVPSSTNPTGVAMGDMDDDGDLDIVTANRGESDGGHSFSVFLNNGSGALATPTDWPISIWNGGLSRVELVLADLDGDGALDAAVAGYEDVSIRRGAGDGTLFPEILTASAYTAYASLLAADLNGDGRLDLAAGTTQRTTADPNVRTGVSIMLNRSCAAPDPCPADINNDGSVNVNDLLAVVGAWGPCPSGSPAPPPPPEGALGDMNCDGQVNTADIAPFMLALNDPVAYVLAYPKCDYFNGDMNGDFSVDNNDLPLFCNAAGGILQGNQCIAPAIPCPADIAPLPDGDGQVNVNDLLAVIGTWGPCP